jgi:hypothetical protein
MKATMEQLQQLGKMIEDGMLNHETVQAVLEKRFLLTNCFGDAIYTAPVDYSIFVPDFAELLKDFDCVSRQYKQDMREMQWMRECSRRCNTYHGNMEVTFELVALGDVEGADEAINSFDQVAYYRTRPATLGELICFTRKFPNLNKKFPIAALGLLAQSHFRGIPYVNDESGQRYLGLCIGRLPKNTRFLAVSE